MTLNLNVAWPTWPSGITFESDAVSGEVSRSDTGVFKQRQVLHRQSGLLLIRC